MRRSYRTPYVLLTNRRLDPYYYDPTFVAHEQKMLTSFPSRCQLGDIYDVLDVTHDSVETRHAEDEEFCVVFLRSQDIGTVQLKSTSGAFLRKTDHENKCKRSKIFHGDVLLNIMASTGDACFYSDECPSEANANRAVGILRAKRDKTSEFEKRFLTVLLSSKVGNLELARNLKGSIQQRLNLADIAECAVPIIPEETCKYIGNKVRDVELLFRYANLQSSILENHYEAQIPVIKPQDITTRVWRPGSMLLDANRLDAKFYTPKYLHVAQQAINNRFVALNQLVTHIRYGTSVEATYVDRGSGLPFVRGTDLVRNRICFAKSVDICESLRGSVGSNLLDEGDIVITRSGTVGIASVVTANVAGAGYGSFMMSMKPVSGVDPFYLAWFLNSWVGANQFARRENGAIQQNINIQELSSVQVWEAPTSFQFAVSGVVKRWQNALDCAELTIECSKLLVEAMIDQQVSASELADAQRMLDQLDQAGDRAILKRLYIGGIDATDTRPLFPDLDAYYDTRQLAEQALSDGGDE